MELLHRVMAFAVFGLLVVLVPGCSQTAFDAAQPEDEAVSSAVNIRNGGSGQVTKTAAASAPKLKMVKRLPPPPNTRGGSIQLLSPGDKLEIKFFGIDKLDRKVTISSSGMISMPLVGAIKAAGKTVRQLERDLERAYSRKYLQNPQISVNVKESMGQRVTVNGEVRRPGIYPIAPNTTLLQSLAQARGFTQLGDPSKVFVFRRINGRQLVARYNVDAIRAGKSPDPRIYGGDIVVTFPSNAKIALQNLQSIMGIARSGASMALLP